MLQTARQIERNWSPLRPANDNLGAVSAFDLWELVDPIVNCADLSGDRQDYETSVFRFPEKLRLFFSALCYLTIVERQGHEVYFDCVYAMQYEDALDFFMQADMGDVARLMEEAGQLAVNGPLMASVGGDAYSAECLTEFDHELAGLNPVARMAGFARRYPDAFAGF